MSKVAGYKRKAVFSLGRNTEDRENVINKGLTEGKHPTGAMDASSLTA